MCLRLGGGINVNQCWPMWANSNTVMAHASGRQKNTYSTFDNTNMGNIDTINTCTFSNT